MYSPAGDEESNDEDSSNGSRQKTSNKKLPPAPGTNTGRWTNEEHQRVSYIITCLPYWPIFVSLQRTHMVIAILLLLVVVLVGS
jgi:hypothetical protein